MSENIKDEVAKTSEEEQKIYVMPERFLGAPPGAKPIEQIAITNAPIKKRKFSLVPIIVFGAIILILGGSGAGVYFIFLKPSKPALITKPEVVAPKIVEKEEEEIVEKKEEISATSTKEEIVEEEGIKIAADIDGDGLTDVEEKVYGSDTTNPDTDKDGFLDGHEVFHLYNPVGLSPVRLLDTSAVKEYTNQELQYQIYFPAPWSVKVLSGTAVFNSNTGEFIEVLIEKNENNLPIISWYLSQAPGVRVGDLATFVTKSNLDGIKSPDRLTAYFTKNGLVYIISYNIGTKKDINYNRTFEMMLNSLKILK